MLALPRDRITTLKSLTDVSRFRTSSSMDHPSGRMPVSSRRVCAVASAAAAIRPAATIRIRIRFIEDLLVSWIGFRRRFRLLLFQLQVVERADGERLAGEDLL